MSDLDQLSLSLFDGLTLETRPYQRRICTKAAAMFTGQNPGRDGTNEPAVSSVMIESPTGSGKTVMGLTIARWLQRSFGVSVGWCAMRRNLLTQAAEENVSRGFGIDLTTISMFDRDPPRVDVLVVDEAQHDAAASMANLHGSVRPRFVLGLTATPFRTDRIKLCFEKIIRDAGIQQLMQDGYLARYHHYTIPTYTPEDVVNRFSAEPERWGKSLMFFHRVDECDLACSLLRARGFTSEVVTAKTDRDRQLDDFETGKTQVLINMAILTEGFDCPSLKTVFCRPSGKGCTIQMAGRAFRKHDDLPFKNVVQSEDSPYPIVRTATPAEQYTWLDDGWRSLAINESIHTISENTLRMIARTEIELPKFVKTRQQKKLDVFRHFGARSDVS